MEEGGARKSCFHFSGAKVQNAEITGLDGEVLVGVINSWRHSLGFFNSLGIFPILANN